MLASHARGQLAPREIAGRNSTPVSWMTYASSPRIGVKPSSWPAAAIFRDPTRSGDVIGELNFQHGFDKSLMPDDDHWLRDYIVKLFNRDSVLMQRKALRSPSHRCLTQWSSVAVFVSDAAGAEALAFLAPTSRGFGGKRRSEYREHPASQAARETLREFHSRAATRKPATRTSTAVACSRK